MDIDLSPRCEHCGALISAAGNLTDLGLATGQFQRLHSAKSLCLFIRPTSPHTPPKFLIR
jgi:hypothetical protein